VDSIIQDKDVCWVCGTEYGLHTHHIYFGLKNRKISDEHGFTVKLCAKHHNASNKGVHFNRVLDLNLKQVCQQEFESQGHTREEFIKLIGKNYLE
jgi:hypothetical protein